MLEAFKGINFTDIKFIVPVIIAVLAFITIVKIAKKFIMLALLIAVIILGGTLWFNRPTVKIDNNVATLSCLGKQYTIDAKSVEVTTKKDGSGNETVYIKSSLGEFKVPFNKDFAQKFIVNNIKNQVK